MTDPDEITTALAAIADGLDGLSVRWAIGGSVASTAYGEPRSTNDIDIVAALTEPQARALVARLGEDYYVDVDAAVDAVRRRSSFNIIDNRSFIKIDVFVPGGGPMGVGQLDRRRELDVLPNARAVPILGPEDVVLQKLRWFRAGGDVSDRQWRDIVAVLRNVGARLDNAFLDEVAQVADLSELLARARHDAR